MCATKWSGEFSSFIIANYKYRELSPGYNAVSSKFSHSEKDRMDAQKPEEL